MFAGWESGGEGWDGMEDRVDLDWEIGVMFVYSLIFQTLIPR